MPFVEPESCRNDRTIPAGCPGIIVLSAACQLRFINQPAIELVRSLDSTFLEQSPPTTIPPCLMDVIESIRAQTTVNGNGSQKLRQINRLVGAAASPIYVQGFFGPDSDKPAGRIVLVLSRPD